jgi:hypothetical protein
VAAPRLRRIGDRVEVAFEEVEAFLDSPGGRRLRRLLAGGLIVTAPLLFRIPGLRRYPLVRTLELIGGAALVVKFAESLRDWEPARRATVVVDVPPSTRS